MGYGVSSGYVSGPGGGSLGFCTGKDEFYVLTSPVRQLNSHDMESLFLHLFGFFGFPYPF